MGSDKALLPWPPGVASQTLLSASIDALIPFTQAVVVVVGNNAENLAPIIAAHGVSMARNTTPERGQFSSFQIGLREALARGCDAAMITLVDCPPLSEASMKRLIDSFDHALANEKWAVVPEHNGKRGHPLVASRQLMDAFLAAPVTSNAREVKHTHASMIETVPVLDLLVSVDVNTPQQYAALSQSELKPR